MRNPRAGRILEHLQELVDIGIELHTQAVLVPGRNDGVHLDRTIADLAALYPTVQDLSVVPVGLTRWHAPDLRVYTAAEAGQVLAQVLDWRERLRDELGVGFVYPSDEWFLRAKREVPMMGQYDGRLSAMVENGVGMVSRFRDHRSALQSAMAGLGNHQTWVTGTLFGPELEAFAQAFSDALHVRVDVVAVENRFFGKSVTVAGLLTVEDVLFALDGRDLGDAVVLPAEAFRGPEGQSLDGAQPDVIQSATGCPVHLVGWDDSGGWSVRSVIRP
jgi:NifB/MoaA-like Fe-S oxidoreductase